MRRAKGLETIFNKKNDVGMDIKNTHENIALFLNIIKSVTEKMDLVLDDRNQEWKL